jgi:hypothetical protein
VLEEVSSELEQPSENVRSRLLELLFLRTGASAHASKKKVCGSEKLASEHNAQVFRDLSTDFAGYMIEDLAMRRILRALRHARPQTAEEYVIDVGANQCQMSVDIGKELRGGVMLVALEPIQRLATLCSHVLWRVAQREGWDVSRLGDVTPHGQGGWLTHLDGLFSLLVVPFAASNVSGQERVLHLSSAGLGCDSLRQQCGGEVEMVTTMTVDDVARNLRLFDGIRGKKFSN